LLNKVAGFVQHTGSLFEVNDMNAIALSEDVGLHTRVPTASLMTKMSSSL